MNIAIIGRSSINSILNEQIVGEGYNPLFLDDINQVVSISGEKGRFHIKTLTKKNNSAQTDSINTDTTEIEAGAIIITDEAGPAGMFENIARHEFPSLSIEAFDNLKSFNDKKLPIVFLLDYPSESPAYMTDLILSRAVSLTAKKKMIIVASKFIRTADSQVEALYKQARAAGVTFIKYKKIVIDYNGETQIFNIDITDENLQSLGFETNILIIDETIPSSNSKETSRLFRLKTDKRGLPEKNTFYLFPVSTNRKGVYLLDGKASAGREGELLTRINYIISDIADFVGIADTSNITNISNTSNITGISNNSYNSNVSNITDFAGIVGISNVSNISNNSNIADFVGVAGISNNSDISNNSNISVKKYAETKTRNTSRDTVLPHTQHAEVDSGKCAFCYTCYRACPHAAMEPDYGNSVMKNLISACDACGICISVCPASAIKLTGSEVDKKIKGVANSVDEAIDNIICNSHPFMDSSGISKRGLYILGCENSGWLALNRLLENHEDIPDEIKITKVSCGGEVTAEFIINLLKEYKNVLVVTCMDNACRHFEGNKRAARQVEKARQLLKAAGMEDDRVACAQISHAMPWVLKDYLSKSLT